MTYLDSFLRLLHTLPDVLIYILLTVSAFVENVFPPVPGDTVTAFGAFLVGTGRLNFLLVYLSTTLGSLAGFMAVFGLGILLGRRFFIRRDLWFFKARDIIRAEEWFRRHGYLLVLINRFLPGMRSVISIAGGISKLRPFRVALLALVSAGAWNLIWLTAGYTLGNNWDAAREHISVLMARYNTAVICLLAIIAALIIIKRLLGRRPSQ